MAITSELPNYPQINQLHEPTDDGMPDENASWNCVPASISSGLEYFTHKSFDGDELKDAVYGQGYTGGQAARDYVGYCHQQGVLLESFDGDPATLVARLHQEIAAGHPVIATIPSKWGIPRDQQAAGYTTHVICFYGEGSGELRALNPWIAPTPHDGSDQYWSERLCDDQIWIMSALAGEVTMPAIPTGWTDSASGDPTNSSGVLTAPNGHKCVRGIRAFVLNYAAPGGWPADNYPVEDEHSQHVMELGNPAIPDGAQQAFRRSVVEYIATDAPNGGPKAGCFEMWVGMELLATRRALQVAQAALAAQPPVPPVPPAPPAPQPAPLTQKQQLELQIMESMLTLVKMP